VTDTGPGIPPESLSKLFQRFLQLEEGKRYEGVGLGLSISKQLAELMGGSVGVESTLGEGSTFSLQLQLEVRPTASSNRLATLERPNSKQLVLVCESRDYVVRFLRHHLEQWGISVHHATSQEEETISPTLNERSLFAVFMGEEGETTQTARDVKGHGSLHEILGRWPSVRGVLIQPSEPRQATTRSETETGFPVLNLPLSILQLHQILSPQRQRGGPESIPSTPKFNHSNCSIDGLHVLIVEDNLSNQAIVKMFLSNLKHTYDIVGDGLSATTAVTNNHYDAVLMVRNSSFFLLHSLSFARLTSPPTKGCNDASDGWNHRHSSYQV
jgi:CheY-like chemotaxis protein